MKGPMHTIRMNVGEVSILLHTEPMCRLNQAQNNGGLSFHAFMEPSEQIDISADGWGHFTCLPGRVQVWVKGDCLI